MHSTIAEGPGRSRRRERLTLIAARSKLAVPVTRKSSTQQSSLRPSASSSRGAGVDREGRSRDVPVRTVSREFRLEEANEALQHMRAGDLRGAAVLKLA